MADGTMKPSLINLNVKDQQTHPAPPPSVQKRPFRPVKDDSKPPLRDPISRSDPIQTEQAMLRLPPFQKSSSQ